MNLEIKQNVGKISKTFPLIGTWQLILNILLKYENGHDLQINQSILLEYENNHYIMLLNNQF